ncbi:MAG TPA: hypothetical protein P5081_15905 [Phycisphaerae bacterium]|nr:hypothetical protein [Phycisphaerae bacterium]HRW54356.1 hypothetical protein [Phycisphaerae bacterium]
MSITQDRVETDAPGAVMAARLDGPPDWSLSDLEIVCPLCGYNLRGLSEARCPECGSEYTWAELLDERRRAHPYLFEHHPERNTWSFRKTLTGGLRVQEFWATLSPLQPTSLWRLIVYVAACWFLASASMAVALVGRELAGLELLAASWGMVNSPRGLGPAFTRVLAYLTTSEFLIICVAPLIWAGVTFLTFELFGVTMQRARIKRRHIARAIAYSFDVIVWFGALAFLQSWGLYLIVAYEQGDEQGALQLIAMLFLVSLIVSFFLITSRSELRARRWVRGLTVLNVAICLALGLLMVQALWDRNAAWVLTNGPITNGAAILTWAVFVGRLVVAVRRYLRFRHTVAVVISTQIITALAIPVGILFYGFLTGHI